MTLVSNAWRCWRLLLVVISLGLGAVQARPSSPEVKAESTTPLVPLVTPAAALATAGLVSIESDLQKADNVTGVITASGNVRIVYPDRRVVATARQAQYFSREARIVLSGDVDVVQPDGNALRAERVTVLLNSMRVVAEPLNGGQVTSSLRLDTASPAATAKP